MKNLYYILLLPALLLTASCANRNTAATAPNTGIVTPNTGSSEIDTEVNPQLTSTIEEVRLAGGDITALSSDMALSIINGWASELSGMTGTDDIVIDLEALRDELSSDRINGSRVSTLLSSLATKTRALESQAPGLSALADALEAGADKLGR